MCVNNHFLLHPLCLLLLLLYFPVQALPPALPRPELGASRWGGPFATDHEYHRTVQSHSEYSWIYHLGRCNYDDA